MITEPELRSAIEPVTWPALLRGTPARLLALHRQFEETQWWLPTALRTHQFRQLQLLLRHAARTVPFYTERLRAAGIDPLEPLNETTWARLPILTRQDVQRAGERLHSAEVPAAYGGISVATTGGSTGIPVRVRRTALDTLMFHSLCLREEAWHREDLAGTIAVVRTVEGIFTAEQISIARSPDGLMLPDWGQPTASVWQTGPMAIIDYMTPIPGQVDFLRRLRPDYLFTYPSNLRLLLGHCREAGIVLPDLRAVWTIAEVVDPALRALCHAVLGVRIVHNYSAAEVGYLALQCPDHPHFHVQSEVVHVEVLDAEGRACKPGQVGRVVVTPLHNFAMPLLRYEIGDEAEAGDACPCGRGLPVLTRVVGRTTDYITTPSGQRRHGVFSTYRLAEITAIREFQIVQRSPERIEALLVLSRPLTVAEEQEARTTLAEVLGQEFRIDLTRCESLPRTQAGKLRSFISDLPQE